MLGFRQRLARDEGLTLIEPLVVLIIIGVLLAIAIPDAVAYYSDNNSYTGVSIATLQGYDSGMTAFAAATSSTPEVPGIATAKGGATKVCISARDAGNYAHVVARAGEPRPSSAAYRCLREAHAVLPVAPEFQAQCRSSARRPGS
jgi:prepilin-type N-terminal cleavage/methylation domain-containing protein